MFSSNTPSSFSQPRTRDEFIERLLDAAASAGDFYVQQFGRLAAIAQSIRIGRWSVEDNEQLIEALEGIACQSEQRALIDVELYRGMLAGKLMARPARNQIDQFDVCGLHPANDTKH
jgi:thiamine pyrophosphate-dependent acetolactate synthase large subunit-like protein